MIQSIRRTTASGWAALRQDRMAVALLGATAIFLLAHFLWITLAYNSLPDLLPLHFDAQGNADRIGERRELYNLPVIALLIGVFNGGVGLLLWLRFNMLFAAYLLWGGGLLAHLLLAIAMWNIVR